MGVVVRRAPLVKIFRNHHWYTIHDVLTIVEYGAGRGLSIHDVMAIVEYGARQGYTNHDVLTIVEYCAGRGYMLSQDGWTSKVCKSTEYGRLLYIFLAMSTSL